MHSLSALRFVRAPAALTPGQPAQPQRGAVGRVTKDEVALFATRLAGS